MMKIRVERYEHIDTCIPEVYLDPKEIYRIYDKSENLIDDIIQVARAFTNAGWEGDGKIELFWLPPFLFDNGDTHGEFIWHVKQSNNGTSFLGFTGLVYNFEIKSHKYYFCGDEI